MKGIILAGGLGTRLYPATISVAKCLLPVYDRPMIYYPLSTLMQAGLKEILVITAEREKENFERLLGDGSQFGIEIKYAVQKEPRGIAEAFIIGEDFINGEDVMLILGDNIFHSRDMERVLKEAAAENEGATVFGQRVVDPERFGVIGYDENFNVISLEEKPEKPKSNTVAVGLYIYDGKVSEYARRLKPSARGELEITDLNNIYLSEGRLKAKPLSKDTAWFDAGTHGSLLQASIYVANIEVVQEKISCPEKIALEKGYITYEQFYDYVGNKKSDYYTRLKYECGKR